MNLDDIIVETEIGLNMSCSIANKLNEQREKINNCRKNTIKLQEDVNTSTIIVEKMMSLGNRIWSYIPNLRDTDHKCNIDINDGLDHDKISKISNRDNKCTDDIDIVRNNIYKIKEISTLIGSELDDQNNTLKNIKDMSENNNKNISDLCKKIDKL